MFDKRLLRLVPGARRFIVLAVVLKWIALAAFIMLSIALGKFVAGIAAASIDGATIAWLASVAAASVIVRFVADAGARYAGAKASSVGKATVRQEVYGKLVRLGPAYREQVSASQAVQICGEGTQQLDSYFRDYLPQLFHAIIAPLTLFAVMCVLSLPAAVVLLACVPLIPVSIVLVMKRAKKAMGSYWDSYVDLGQEFLEAIRGLVTLKAYRADGRRQDEMRARAESFRIATMKVLSMQLSSVALMDFFTFGGAAAGIIVVLFHYAGGMTSLANALAVMLLAVEFFMPMRVLGSYFHTAMGASAVIEQVFALLDAPESEAGTETVGPGGPDVMLDGVGYVYPDGRRALVDVDFAVTPDSFVGVTGENGSGKSTLAGILAGEIRGYTGRVLIGGVEARDIAPESMRQMVTCVSSDEYVFKGTFRSNLLMGDANASDFAMWNALGRCRLDDFVLRAGGLDAPVAEAGGNLSGGQRQRLCVARAALRSSPLYVFDEATSNVDAESERDILTFVQELAFSRTVILISHRLASLVWTDDITVLEGGRVAQRGTHAVLVARQGVYARLWSQQERLELFAREVREVGSAGEKTSGEADIDVPAGMAEAMDRMPVGVATAALQVMKGARIRALANGGTSPTGHPPGIPRVGASSEDGRLPTAGTIPSAASGSTSRSALDVMRGLLSLSRHLVPPLVLSTALGVAGCAAALLMTVFATCGLLGLNGLEPSCSLVAAAVEVGVLGVMRGFLRYGERLNSHNEAFRTLAFVRDRVFGHMRLLAPARLEQRDAGDLVALLTADVELLETFYARTLSTGLVAIVVSAGVVTFVGFRSLPLAVTALACYLAIGVMAPLLLSRAVNPLGRALRARAVRTGSFVLESLRGLPETLRYGCADLRAAELGGRLGALSGSELTMARRSAFGRAATEALVSLSMALAALVAGFSASQGALDAGSAVLCTLLIAVSFGPVVGVADLGSSLHQTMAGGGRILDFLEEEPQTPEIVDGETPLSFMGARLDGVGFSYGKEEVLRGVDFAVERGAIVHVTGKSGAGKSTMLKLLMRFWDAQAGIVSVSGNDIRHVNTTSLRTLEGFMTQETYLFPGTIRENILLVCPDATEDQLADAVGKASLADFIEGLPRGLDTPVGEVGGGLSDGERQRIGLARLFLYDAPFMLIDEPTSNLDSLNEAAVLQSLAEGGEGKAMIIVSHRNTASAIADLTYRMEGDCLS